MIHCNAATSSLGLSLPLSVILGDVFNAVVSVWRKIEMAPTTSTLKAFSKCSKRHVILRHGEVWVIKFKRVKMKVIVSINMCEQNQNKIRYFHRQFSHWSVCEAVSDTLVSETANQPLS